MRRFGKFIVVIICILICFTAITVSAETVNSEVVAEPNEEVVVRFEFSNIAGINGTFNLSDPSLFSEVDVKVEGLQGFYNKDNGMVAYYGPKPVDVVIYLRLTVVNTAQVGDKCDVTFVYESTSDGKLPPEPVYEYNYATITIVNSINFDKLKAQIVRAEALDEEDYTAVSWARMKSALNKAKLALTSRDQNEVDTCAKNLKDAIDSLVEVSIDYSELKKQIQRAEDLIENEYTPASWEKLESALARAKAALSSKDQSTVDSAAKGLKNAIADLVKIIGDPVDYSELKRQIAIAEGLKESNYTASSWSAMEKALTKAKSALGSTEQSVVDKAAEALEDAIASLVKKSDAANIDYTELERQIAIAQSLKETDYLVDCWNEMMEALDFAYTALSSESQAAVDMAAQELRQAIENLVRVDYSALLKALEELSKYIDEEELAGMWGRMHELINEANDLLYSRDQEAINACAAEITQLLADIIKKLSEMNGAVVEVEKVVEVEPEYGFCNRVLHKLWPILLIISFVLNLAFIGLIVTYVLRKRRKVNDDTPLVDYDITDDEE